MIADLNLGGKVRYHNQFVEIPAAEVASHPFAKDAKGWATRGWSSTILRC
jgi:hypothetical protein